MKLRICSSLGPTLLLFYVAVTRAKESTDRVECIDDDRFYRNPKTPAHKIWTQDECAKYYLCLDNDVFEFKCSNGLLFDVSRQICDFKANVDNCDVSLEERPPKPLLDNGKCEEGTLACGDGTCLPSLYFCDGSVDCPDASDEAWCDPEKDRNAASSCDSEKCKLPDCWCSKDGTKVPGNLNVSNVPQMISITFNDAVNAENIDLYANIFSDARKNPNGCPIRGTFYVSHQFTNYRDVQSLWNRGHEIAAHSVTHRGPEEWWSRNATIEDWFDEMVGEANIIHKYGGVRIEEIRGLRVPFLQVGWNRQFLMMLEFGFAYDSSIVAPFNDPPIWPYTLDHQPPHVCSSPGQLCPTRSYAGLWEIPVNELLLENKTCSMVDSCTRDLRGEEIYRMLTINFNRHYLQNRAPLGLYFHADWFKNPSSHYAFLKFIDDTLQLPDVYFVTSNQMIEWMRNPTPLNQLQNFQPWKCGKRHFEPREIACVVPNTCKLYSSVLKSDRYLYTCFDCPKQYPWLRNEFGLN
ncbi:chitin deacetylase 1 [Athalia rosae]|uniref:chitin deacetylase 1 n=1 Tax=Athalia rosae TaxID=37344 RepID=UPI002033CC58|nr:chitin deacetylase 1 [Athalia rosae]